MAVGRRAWVGWFSIAALCVLSGSLQTQCVMGQDLDESGALMEGPALPDSDFDFCGQFDLYGVSGGDDYSDSMPQDDDPDDQQAPLVTNRVATDRQAAKARQHAEKLARIAKNKAKNNAKGTAKSTAKSAPKSTSKSAPKITAKSDAKNNPKTSVKTTAKNEPRSKLKSKPKNLPSPAKK